MPMDPVPNVSSMVDVAALKNAKASGGNRNYARPGSYMGVFQSASFGRQRTGNLPFFAAEYKIEWAAPGSEMKVGEVMDYFADGGKDWFLNNVKMVVQAVLGLSQPEIAAMSDTDFQQVLNGLFGPEQLATGVWVRCRATKGITKKGPRAGQENCIPAFTHPTEQDWKECGISPPTT